MIIEQEKIEAVGEENSVLILGGNPKICAGLESDLRRLGFNPLPGRYPDVDSHDIHRKSPGIILLELTEYDHNALSVCDLLLKENSLLPGTTLVALVSENTMGQIPMDYKFADIIKFPYGIAELGFRIQRAMHLYQQEPARDTIHIGNLSLSPSRYEVRVSGQPVDLSYKEYSLLKFLITHPNRVLTRDVLLNNIWGRDTSSDSRTVDIHIHRIRAKIGDISSTYIKTVRRAGYIFRFGEE